MFFVDVILKNALIISILFSFFEMVSCVISPLKTKNLITDAKNQ